MRLLNRISRSLLLLTTLFLTACAVQTLHYSTDAPQWQQHQRELGQIRRYQVRGAFAWVDGKQKLYARFFWQQNSPEDYRLLLTNPFGGTQLDLHVQPDVVQLTDSKGRQYTATDPEQLIAELTGMKIPLNNLRQWIIGLPGETSDYVLNQNYRLKSIDYHENGQHWHVNYQGYSDNQLPAMPEEIILNQGDLQIKLKINQWTLA